LIVLFNSHSHASARGGVSHFGHVLIVLSAFHVHDVFLLLDSVWRFSSSR